MNMNWEPIDWDNLDLSGTGFAGSSPTSYTGNKSPGGFAGTSPLASPQPQAPAKIPEAPSSFSTSLNMGPALTSAPAAPANDAFSNAPKWAQHGISGNWGGLLSERPDVATEYQQESTRDKKSKAYLQQIGATSPENYAKWWWGQWGGDYANTQAPAPAAPAPPATNPGYTPPTLNDWVNTPLTPLPGTGAATTGTAPDGTSVPVAPIGVPAIGGFSETPGPAVANVAQLAAEQARLDGLLGIYSPMAYKARTNANTAGAYDDNYLQSLDDEMSQILEQMGREKPNYGLSLDLSPYTGIIEGARQTLAGKRTRFNSGLQKELADIASSRTRLSEIEDWDEDGLNYIASLLGREGADLGRYTGDKDSAATALDDAMRLIDERRYRLSRGRSAVEAEAQAALTGLETAHVDNPSLAQLFSQYGALRGRSQQWKSTQSNDELEQIYRALSGHKSRLATDANNVAAREAAEAALVNKDRRGNSRFSSAMQASRDGVMSEGQYRAYRSRLKDPTMQSYPSSFTTNLGI